MTVKRQASTEQFHIILEFHFFFLPGLFSFTDLCRQEKPEI